MSKTPWMMTGVCLLASLVTLAGCGQEQESWEWLHGLSDEEAAELVAEISNTIEEGNFQPSIESLRNYEVPEWFRDAKFGLWVCYAPQAVAARDGWYGRHMYGQYTDPSRGGEKKRNPVYDFHVKTFGHPSEFGFKDLIPQLTAANFDPDRLVGLFKNAGAKYVVALAVHHENFDLWNSKYHRWNAVNMGPRKDMIGLWREAVLKQGLRWGVTSHLARSYSWFSTAHGSDEEGPLKDVPYDGADPDYADFYHTLRPEEVSQLRESYVPLDRGYPVNPPASWKLEFFLRVKDLLDNYKPDLFYFDGNVPFGPDGHPGLEVISHFYNANTKWNGGQNEAVMNIKDFGTGVFDENIGVLDLERRQLITSLPRPWQNDTSIGPWFYEDNAKYQPPRNIIHALVDIVSKNGNLLLNVPMRADGTLDEQEISILEEIGVWMEVNSEAIHDTRPWKEFGENYENDPNDVAMWHGTVAGAPERKHDMGGMEDRELRFTSKGNTLYAIAAGWPEKEWVVRSLGSKAGLADGKIASVALLGSEAKLEWRVAADGLHVKVPAEKPCEHAWALKVVTVE